ncbi:MAG: hypothetical protein ACI4I5_04545 [Acutalibacteraceae bacterium]
MLICEKKNCTECEESKSLVTPEEVLRLLGECTFADSRIVSWHVKYFQANGDRAHAAFGDYALYVMLWNAGRVQGIREERIRRMAGVQ